jgi:hypothetical protein
MRNTEIEFKNEKKYQEFMRKITSNNKKASNKNAAKTVSEMNKITSMTVNGKKITF